MPYFKTCPACGSHLDPGEKCDCTKENAPPSANGEASKQLSGTPVNNNTILSRAAAPVNKIKIGRT
jgi:hypothetical protein